MVIQKVGIKFTLACRWAFPYDHGGVAMHNYYLLQVMKNELDVSLISSKNEENADTRWLKKGLNFHDRILLVGLAFQKMKKTWIPSG